MVPVLLSMKKNPFIYTKYYYSILFLIFISGFDCETTLSDCDSDPCLHGGTCGHDFYTSSYTTAIYGGTPITWPVYTLRYYCYCAAAYSGKYIASNLKWRISIFYQFELKPNLIIVLWCLLIA